MMSEFKDNKSKEEGDLPLSLSAAVEPFVVAEGLPFFGDNFDFVIVSLSADEVVVVAVASTNCTSQPSRIIIAAIFFPRNVALVPQI